MINLVITEGNTKQFDEAVKDEMQKSLTHFEHELTSIRSGRAHPSMVESIKVSCYGGESELPLKNLASISTPEARSLFIQPWDQATLLDIERALKESDLGITPLNDGAALRLQFPEMSMQRRDELIKLLGRKLEETRVAIRNMRKHFQGVLRDHDKKKLISEDFSKRLNDLLQKHTDLYIKKAEDLSTKKESELKS